jgi:DNA topoisomerase VI subunit A
MADKIVIDKIKEVSNSIYKEIVAESKPEISMPLRTLQNVTYSEGVGYFELDNKFKNRTLTANTVKTFAQTLKMMALSKTLVETDDIATKRERHITSARTGARQGSMSSLNQTL